MNRNILAAIVLMLHLNICLKAQFNYDFSALGGTYTSNVSPTIIHIANTDEAISPKINIGFNFNYGCIDYTKIKVGSNGWITFDTTITVNYDVNNLDTNTDQSIVAPLWDDLQVSSTGSVNYKLTGIAPNRIFTVEWKEMKWGYLASAWGISFQCKLYETTNVLEFNYFRNGNSTQFLSTPSASIGISYSTVGQFYSLDGTGVSPAASTLAETNTLSTKPADGQIYRFTPSLACAGTPVGGSVVATPSTITSCASPNTVLTLSGASTNCGTTYQWQSSPNNATWTNLVGATNSTLTTNPLTNTYYQCVLTCFNSGLSSISTSTLVTVNTNPPANDGCSGAIALTVNPFGSCTIFASGDVSCASASGVGLGTCLGTPNDDVWYKFIATSGTHYFTLTSGFNAYMQLFSGVCGTLNSIQCSDPNTFSASGLLVGSTYYLRVYSFPNTIPADGSFTLCVSEPPACPANLGAGNVTIAALPYSGTSQTTCGAVNDLTPTNTATCGTANYFSDADKVYIFTPTTSGQITVTLNSIQSLTSATLFAGCPFSGTCVAFVQSSNSGSKNFCTSVVSGSTYYLVIDGFGTSGGCISSFTLTISAPSTGTANDLPCAATALTIGLAVTGDNSCTSGAGEPPGNPVCWTSGSKNTVWYSFIAPSSTINISTTLGTLTAGTQIALYSGTCSSLTIIGCNEDPLVGCQTSTSANSLLDATGLVLGATYFVRVDGENDSKGTFTITVANGASGSNSPIPGQDCAAILVACNSIISNGNPGYTGTGNICDFDGVNDCTSGEKNSLWYQINIAVNGFFNFTLIPNDGDNLSCGLETDYDFLLWKLAGSGVTTTCPGIFANSSTGLLACNYDGYGVTGIAPNGNAPSPIGSCFNFAFEPSVAVTAGDILYLCVQNFTGSTQGFDIDFNGSGVGVVEYIPPTTVFWTGGAANTVWSNSVNWGSCSVLPSCTVSAVATIASSNQPAISGTESVKDLIINPGATLTLNAGATLTICGNFTNNGSLICSPTSNLVFTGSDLQAITGNFTGLNKFANVTINKSGGSVLLNDDLDIGGNLTISNPTSIFNTSNQYIKLAGNFSNSGGGSTFLNTEPLGTLEFNGSVSQVYNEGTSILALNKVLLNNAVGGAVSLASNMNFNATSGSLSFNTGKIITNTFEVNIANTDSTSVSVGNTTSFVQGNLRRSISSLGSYDFPVGNSSKGYQRVNINFTGVTTISNLLAKFDLWPGAAPVQGSSECSASYNQGAQNNGYWTITANANPTSGVYNMSLYPLNASNTLGISGWTIMKDPLITSNSWSLNGDCVISTATQVTRENMNGFSVFGVAQSLLPLPVELLFFRGKEKGNQNLLEWSTATEINNDYFDLEKSKDGIEFESLAIINGNGSSSVINNYKFYDKIPFEGVSFYRLKQVDYDGNFKFSKTISIQQISKEIKLENLHPNPTSNIFTFDLFTPINGEVFMQLFDYTGAEVMKKKYFSETGKSTYSVDMDRFSAGIYCLKVTFDKLNYSSLNRVVKQ